MALTEKQQLFCDEYMIDLNATQAAIRAGYSQKTAYSIGEENLRKPEIHRFLQDRMQERAARIDVDKDHVLRRLVDIDQMDLLDILNEDGSIKAFSQWPKIWRQFLSGIDVSELFEGRGNEKKMIGIMKKIKWPDKVKNLELIGKHLGMFNEKRDHKHSFLGKDGTPLKLNVNIKFVRPGDVKKVT